MIIPSSVTSIGDFIVSKDTKLRKIVIPSNAPNIGKLDFQKFTSLTEFTIPLTVTRIYEKQFDGCSSLKMIEIPSSITFIEQYAFCGCSSLNEITIPPSITSIENGTFLNCKSLTTVNIQSSLTLIGFKAFDNCKSLIDIKIPSVKKIGFNAFQHCKSLKRIEILITQDIEIMIEFPKYFSIGLVGNSNTGKTCIVNRFTENIFDENTIESIAADCKSKIINVQGYDIRFHIFDIAGNERFRTLSIDFCRNMKGNIIVFDLTNVESFYNVSDYLKIFDSFQNPVETIFIGNKSDLIHEVSDKDILEIVSKYNIKYFEVSAKNDTNINDAFQYMANKIVNNYLSEKNVLLNLINKKKKCSIY